MHQHKRAPIDRLIRPINEFMHWERSSGLVLFACVVVALILANSPWAEHYFHFFEHEFGLNFDGKTYLQYSLHHWINDGLMAVFFFVVGLELKREIVGGELSNPRQALVPIVAAGGGMLAPALIYIALNPTGETQRGWGIPTATDIAFALGVLYLLGTRIPHSLKVFLTALAIVDDLGAVLVIALFYSSELHYVNLGFGLSMLAVMYIGNRLGVRSILFYGIFGILGVWTSFLLSGVHATIAAVLAAFTIPANVRLSESTYLDSTTTLLNSFGELDPNNDKPTLTEEQLHLLEMIKRNTLSAMTPLQRLEHSMHPFVAFIVVPIFALANAGVAIDPDPQRLFSTNVLIGVGLGLLFGKVIGVVGTTWLCVKSGLAKFPEGMNVKSLFGLGLLAAIGFTMSLFVTNLAFSNEEHIMQAKIGIFCASIVGGVAGYFVLLASLKKVTPAASEQ